VASREVEEVLHQHPAVYEATVVGVPDKEWGSGKAIVALKPESRAKLMKGLDRLLPAETGRLQEASSIDFVESYQKNAAVRSKGKLSKKLQESIREERDKSGTEIKVREPRYRSWRRIWMSEGKVTFTEALITDEMLAEVRKFIGTKFRIGHSINTKKRRNRNSEVCDGM